MQASVPELTDLKSESKQTLAMYGDDVLKPGTFAANCLLARRMVERGVRFVQIFHRGWDQHGALPRISPCNAGTSIKRDGTRARSEQRGLLEDTLVIWGGEFAGRSTAKAN